MGSRLIDLGSILVSVAFMQCIVALTPFTIARGNDLIRYSLLTVLNGALKSILMWLANCKSHQLTKIILMSNRFSLNSTRIAVTLVPCRRLARESFFQLKITSSRSACTITKVCRLFCHFFATDPPWNVGSNRYLGRLDMTNEPAPLKKV